MSEKKIMLSDSGIQNMKDSPVPYGDLHIYYVEGCVSACDKIADSEFIGNWEEDGFSFLFFSEPSQNTVENLLNKHPDLTLLDQFCMSYEEWQGGRVRPFVVGGFLISPPWERGTKEDIGHLKSEILLDPGVVFGTGTHPTTHDCLEILEKVCQEEQIETVLDLGTGTGLLALAAGQLGCRQVLGVDFNFLAAKTTERNIRLNHLEDQVLAIQARAEDFIDHTADMVIANIHYDVMKQLVVSKSFLDKKWFILSGLLRSEARDIAWKLSQSPVNILETRERDGVWHTFFGVRSEK